MRNQRLANVKHFFIATAMVAVIATVGIGCSGSETDTNETSTTETFEVITSLYPVYYFASAIAEGGPINLTDFASNRDVHDLELTPRQVALLSDADLALFVHPSLEHSLAMFSDSISGVKFVELGDRLNISGSDSEDEHAHDEDEHAHDEDKAADDEDEHAHDEDKAADDEDEHAHDEHEAAQAEDEHEHAHGTEADFHVWLDPVEAVELAELIRDEIVLLDQSNSEIYNDNAAKLIERLNTLHTTFQSELMPNRCEHSDVVILDSTFEHVANRYDFQLNQFGISADHTRELSAAEIVQIIDNVNSNGVEHILVTYSNEGESGISQAIREEANITSLFVYAVDYAPNSDWDYFSLMEANMQAFSAALQCG